MMRGRLVFVLAVALAAAGAALAEEPSVALSLQLPDNPTAGARLFAEKSCVRCHALGAGERRVGPDLARIHLKGTVLDLAGAFWNHGPVMREKMRDLKIPPPTLTSQEMADLAAFLTAYRYYLTELGEPADAMRGREVFAAKGCANCHGGAEAWNKPGPSLERYRGHFSAIYLAQAMWNHGPEMAAVMRRRGTAWPKFAGREMGDLIAYLQAGGAGPSAKRVYFEPGSPRAGRDLFVTKRCAECHAINGVGGHGGPDLGRRGRDLVGSVSAVAGLMWNHSQGMAAEFHRRGIPRVTFSGQEMADVIAYLYFINYANVRGHPERGGTLFSANCATCHSMDGRQAVGTDLVSTPRLDEPLALMAAMWTHAPRMEEEHRQRGLAWPRFQPGDTADLAAFLLWRRAPGAPARH